MHEASSNIAHDPSIKHLQSMVAWRLGDVQGVGEPKIVHFLLPYTSFDQLRNIFPASSHYYLEFQLFQYEICTTQKTDNGQPRERPLNRLKGQPAEKMVTHCLTSLFRLLL